MLQRDLATDFMAGVHSTTEAILSGLDIGGIKKHIGGCWGAQVEGKGAIGANGDSRWNGDAGVHMSGTSVEFLSRRQLSSEGNVRHLEAFQLDDSLKRTHLAKIHALDTLGTQGWTNGGARTSLTRPDNEFDKLVFG